MKRFVTATLLVLVLTASEPALAADIAGLYVAPKLLWSYQMHDQAKLDQGYSDGANPTVGLKAKSDDAWGGALAIGYDFMPKFSWPVRAELEYAVRSQSKNSWHSDQRDGTGYGYVYDVTRKMNVSSLFANVYYDIKTGTKFTPYVGGGIGLAQIRVKDNFGHDWYMGGPDPEYGPYSGSSKRTVTNFAWNLAAGVAYSFDNNWSLDLGYRYCDFGKVKGATAADDQGEGYTYKAKSNVTAHEVMLGVRYTF